MGRTLRNTPHIAPLRNKNPATLHHTQPFTPIHYPHMKKHFLGLRTVCYPAPRLEETKKWYTEALGYGPYFDQPFYVGFNVGGFELGLDPDAPKGCGDGTQVYWGVDNIEEALEHLVSIGAEIEKPVQDVGDGIKVASVLDPFGNEFGVIENPHFTLG